MHFDVEVEVVWELKGTWAFMCFSHRSLECCMDHLGVLFPRDGLISCENIWIILGFKTGWRRKIKRWLSAFSPWEVGIFPNKRVWDWCLNAQWLRNRRDQTPWGWDRGLRVVGGRLGDWGAGCVLTVLTTVSCQGSGSCLGSALLFPSTFLRNFRKQMLRHMGCCQW